jgi:hypothetical protein
MQNLTLFNISNIVDFELEQKKGVSDPPEVHLNVSK